MYIKRLRDKSHVTISFNAEKVFDKTQHPFRIWALKNLKAELNIIKLHVTNSQYYSKWGRLKEFFSQIPTQ